MIEKNGKEAMYVRMEKGRPIVDNGGSRWGRGRRRDKESEEEWAGEWGTELRAEH
jgi:hypothetical protein